jgi:hypothetical protein
MEDGESPEERRGFCLRLATEARASELSPELPSRALIYRPSIHGIPAKPAGQRTHSFSSVRGVSRAAICVGLPGRANQPSPCLCAVVIVSSSLGGWGRRANASASRMLPSLPPSGSSRRCGGQELSCPEASRARRARPFRAGGGVGVLSPLCVGWGLVVGGAPAGVFHSLQPLR